MSLFSSIKFISGHPLNRKNKSSAILRFLKWQINNLLNPYPVIYQFTDRSKLIIKKGMTGATGNLYCGFFDYEEMFFLLHFLRRNDLFVDIGANVGSYTVLASAHVQSNSISIEPVPSTYRNLLNNIILNNLNNVKTFNIALGAKKGIVKFTNSNDTTNHVATLSDNDQIDVEISTLDDILLSLDSATLIKIDVEGYETEVLKGSDKILENNNLKAIIIELNGSGNRYNYDETLIHNKLIDVGFLPFTYDPISRQLIKLGKFGAYNTIYVRDLDFVIDRLKSADKVNIYNTLI
jgi:FkbM family methyltransferase